MSTVSYSSLFSVIELFTIENILQVVVVVRLLVLYRYFIRVQVVWVLGFIISCSIFYSIFF
jgi:hypothetical protein